MGFLILSVTSFSWGFYAHQKINYLAVFMLPPEMLVFYKQHIDFISEHAVDPDKRRYAVAEEGARHYIDIDHYGHYPYDSLPRNWKDAVNRYSEDTLNRYGIVPWWIPIMHQRLVKAFKERNGPAILKLSAEIGHYIADAHVPLHASSNHDGQLTGQRGIHGFWESRIPELLAEKEWDLFTGKASYIKNTRDLIWKCVLQSALASDTVLRLERELTSLIPADRKFAFEERNGKMVRQYSAFFTIAYNDLLKGMVEKRMRASIDAVASFWFTAWVEAGQPNLSSLAVKEFSESDRKEFALLNQLWKGEEH